MSALTLIGLQVAGASLAFLLGYLVGLLLPSILNPPAQPDQGDALLASLSQRCDRLQKQLDVAIQNLEKLQDIVGDK